MCWITPPPPPIARLATCDAGGAPKKKESESPPPPAHHLFWDLRNFRCCRRTVGQNATKNDQKWPKIKLIGLIFAQKYQNEDEIIS